MALVIFIITIILMMASFIFFPKIRIKTIKIDTYWLIVLGGAFFLFLFNLIDTNEWWANLTSSNEMNPLKLVILFIMMTVMSLFLDEVGFFKFLALNLVNKIKDSQYHLFFALYFLVSLLTIFTSNDIIILTLTPLIIYLTKQLRINPLPYLFGVLVAANTWSITLLIGNPTNIYLAANQAIDFISYLKVMYLPGLVAGISGFFLLILFFRRDLKKPIEPLNEKITLAHRPLVYGGLLSILLTIILLAFSHFISLPMWLIVTLMSLMLTTYAFIYLLIKKQPLSLLGHTYKRAPWTFLPLVLGMFTLVEGLRQSSYLSLLSNFLSSFNPVFGYGISSYLLSNVMNNQPMSMLYSSLLPLVSENARLAATYASIIGSNIGVLLTPFGALAGLMWMSLLKEQGIKLSFFGYIKKICLIGIIILILSLSSLFVTLSLI